MKTSTFISVALTLALLLASLGTVKAQEKENADTSYWTYEGITSLNFSQVAFKNWAAGGENSYSVSGLVNLAAGYNKDKLSWENSLDMAYGIVKQNDNPLKKSDDKINFSSKLGYKTNKKWFYTVLLDFKTQFNETFVYGEDTKTLKSDFLSPGYLLYSGGMDYKPFKALSIYISAVTGKSTYVINDTLAQRGAFGLEEGQKSRTELGGYVKIKYSQEILKNVTVKSKVDLFSNYLNHPENIDVNWELFVNMKINEFLSANINLHLLYDDDVDIVKLGEKTSPKVQFKEAFGMGISYNF